MAPAPRDPVAPRSSDNDGVCDVAILVSYSGDGGVERMINHLIAGLLATGARVDVLVLKTSGGHFAGLPEGARVRPLASRHAAVAVPELVAYLRRERPPVLLAAKDRAGRAAIRARGLAGGQTRVFVRIGNTLSQALAGKSGMRRAWRYRVIRRLYPRADGIIAVSQGVADDVVATAGVPHERVHVAPNPVVIDALARAGSEPPPHPWFQPRTAPVILAVARLTEQKDLPTLLRAFARLDRGRGARLIILGEGEDRPALEALAARLGIRDRLDMPGFVANPHAYVGHADLCVLSSAWEGSPNVLVEALALGIAVVATDCRSGPREILAEGRYGPLVPVGDADALAAAMAAVLDDPLPAATLRAAAQPYNLERSARRYREILGLGDGAGAC